MTNVAEILNQHTVLLANCQGGVWLLCGLVLAGLLWKGLRI